MLCPKILVCGYWLAYGDIRMPEAYRTYVRSLEDIYTEHRGQDFPFTLNCLWIGCLSKKGEAGERGGKNTEYKQFCRMDVVCLKKTLHFFWNSPFKLKKGASGKSLPLAPELMQLKICAKKLYENWLVVGLGHIMRLSEIFQFFL